MSTEEVVKFCEGYLPQCDTKKAVIEIVKTFDCLEQKVKEREIERTALKIYGKESQMRMCIEEMAELTKELCKNLRYGDNRNAIVEEIADVEIMLEQMQILFNAEHDVVAMKYGKLERLKERMLK